MAFLKIIYNFTYRLSGNTRVAEVLTEKVLLMQSANHHNGDVVLLKQAWNEFLKYDGSIDCKGENATQQTLLSLPPEMRCAIILRDVLGYSYRQIAAVLNISDLEVGKFIARGRQEITRTGK